MGPVTHYPEIGVQAAKLFTTYAWRWEPSRTGISHDLTCRNMTIARDG